MALPDISTYDAAGGEKADYQPPEDPTTDRAAAEVDDVFADVTQGTRTAIRAYVAFTVSGSTCTVVEHEAVWGHDVSVKPTVAYSATGSYVATFPAIVTDARGISHNVNFRRGWVNVEQTGYSGEAKKLTPNTVEIKVFGIVAAAAANPTGAVVAFLL